MQRNLTQN